MELKWRDRARDEDGYLVEVTTDLDEPFKVGALLDPNVTSYVFPNLPLETRCHFRVRAFFYGEPSNLAEKSTGAEPPTR